MNLLAANLGREPHKFMEAEQPSDCGRKDLQTRRPGHNASDAIIISPIIITSSSKEAA